MLWTVSLCRVGIGEMNVAGDPGAFSFEAEGLLWTCLGSYKKGLQSEIKRVFHLQDLLPIS